MSDKPLSQYTYGELLDELDRRRRETIQVGIPESVEASPKAINVVIASTVIEETLDRYGVYGVTYVGADNASLINIHTPKGLPLGYDKQTDRIEPNFDAKATNESFGEAVTQWGLMRQQTHQLVDKLDRCCAKLAVALTKEEIDPPAELCDPVATAPLDVTDCNAVEQRLSHVEETIDLLLRRNEVNGVIGLCAGMHSRGSCLIADPMVANKATRETKQGLLQEIALAHQLNRMVVRISEGTAQHLDYVLDVARSQGADVSKILQGLAEVESNSTMEVTQHSKSKFARPNPDTETDKLN